MLRQGESARDCLECVARALPGLPWAQPMHLRQFLRQCRPRRTRNQLQTAPRRPADGRPLPTALAAPRSDYRRPFTTGRPPGRTCGAERHTDRVRVAQGPAPPATGLGPGICPSFQPWQHLHQIGLPSSAATGRHHQHHGEAGRMPGQRRRGNFLGNLGQPIHQRPWPSRADVVRAIFASVASWYNRTVGKEASAASAPSSSKSPNCLPRPLPNA